MYNECLDKNNPKRVDMPVKPTNQPTNQSFQIWAKDRNYKIQPTKHFFLNKIV